MSVRTMPKHSHERTPPRRRRPRRSVWRKTVWPLLKFMFLVSALVFGLQRVTQPLVLYSRESRETRDVQTELQRLQKENADLERRIKHLQTPEGAAQAARDLGWVKPGEITLILPDETNKKHGK
ncbi:MAG: septum formation initiator family protein [Armatimonadota bacterium]|nr:septum formation initiator family protein [bacterium]